MRACAAHGMAKATARPRRLAVYRCPGSRRRHGCKVGKVAARKRSTNRSRARKRSRPWGARARGRSCKVRRRAQRLSCDSRGEALPRGRATLVMCRWSMVCVCGCVLGRGKAGYGCTKQGHVQEARSGVWPWVHAWQRDVPTVSQQGCSQRHERATT